MSKTKTKTQNPKSMNRIALQKRLEFHERLGRHLSEEDALNVDFFMNITSVKYWATKNIDEIEADFAKISALDF